MHWKETDEAVRRLAARQHGAFAARQLEALGIGRGVAKRRVDRGDWLRLGGRVYALSASADSWHRSLMAAQLSAPDAAITGRAALQLYRLPAGRRCRADIVTGSRASTRNSLATVHQTTRTVRTRIVDGIRVVSPEEAIVRAAGFLPGLELERNLDVAMNLDLVRYGRLNRILQEVGDSRLPGIGLLRPLVAERRPGWVVPESHLESALRQVLRHARVPRIEYQMNFPWLPAANGRVDAVIPDWRLILEADGRHYHARNAAFEADRLRDNRAMANGYGVMRFTPFQLGSCRAEVVELIEAAGRWRQTG